MKTGRLTTERKRIAVILVVFCALLVWWGIRFGYTNHGYQTVALTPGEDTFTAPFPRFYFISCCNEDAALRDALDAEPAHLEMTVTDDDGSLIYEGETDSVKVHTNGFTNIDNNYMTGMPVELTVGETYHFSYVCTASDGSAVTDLSFLIYGDASSVHALTFFWYVLAFVVFAVLVWFAGRKELPLPAFAICLACLLTLTVFYLPAANTDASNGDYANVYAMSGRLLGRPVADGNGYAYIEEDAIRNDGYSTFGEPYWRFFADCPERIFARTEGLSSVNYPVHLRSFSLLQVPAVLGVALMRAVSAPYQLVRLAPALVNGLIFLVLMLAADHLLGDRKKIRTFFRLFCLLPSVTFSALSASGYGIFLCLLALAGTLYLTGQRRGALIPAVLAVFYPVSRLIGGLGGGIGGFLPALLSDYDNWLMESIGGDDRFLYGTVFTGILLLVVLADKAVADREILGGGTGEKGLSAFGLIPATVVLVLVSGTFCAPWEAIQGTLFLPLFLIPWKWKGDGALLKRYDAAFEIVSVYCVIALMLTRLSIL